MLVLVDRGGTPVGDLSHRMGWVTSGRLTPSPIPRDPIEMSGGTDDEGGGGDTVGGPDDNVTSGEDDDAVEQSGGDDLTAGADSDTEPPTDPW